TINENKLTVLVDPAMKLLWFLRDELGLTGTKYSCGKALCGTCTVLIDGKAVKSCSIAVGKCDGKSITTIEGLSQNGDHPLQKAWIAEDVSQCGYCQPGQIMAATELLSNNPNPGDKDINKHMNKVLCRCGTYNRIRKAIHTAAEDSK
ncbi:(2Fe-2S)-binding protein, partial [Candidatus Neomarinimicrobiota bacterium]